MLEWLKVLGPIVLSWPVVSLVIVLIFRRPLLDLIDRFSNSSGSKAEIGPLKIELGKLAEEGKDAVGRLNRTTELMAESRLLELEITSGMFGSIFSDEQRDRLERQIEELRMLTNSQVPNSAVEGDAPKSARPSL
ncbi:MAG: hypothetical protein K2Y10_05805 [Burkholderiaceae bacterium]|nr:hypothetical protein [Burkholderiaceae bacterium]